MEWLKKHGDTITIVLAVAAAIMYSQYQLGGVYGRLITMQDQVSKNQATLAEFIRGHEKAHEYIYGDPPESGSR